MGGMKRKRNIVITGGNSGLGRATAELLSKNDNVIILTRKEVDPIPGIKNYKCDVTNPEEIESTVKKIIEEFGTIDILINNAGVWLAGDIVENTYEQISNCIDVNLKGTLFMMRAVLPYMYEQNKGLVINIGSQASFDTDDYSPVYNASKWGVRAITLSENKDSVKHGVKLEGFYPGFMQTKLFEKAGNNYDTSTGLEPEKMAKSIEFMINAPEDVVFTEVGMKDIQNY